MASRISRKVCILGRPGALGTGRWGSIQDHSASDKSVWYALLMLGTLPSHLLKAPFRTVSPRTPVNKGIKKGRSLVRLDPSNPLRLRRRGRFRSLWDLGQTFPEALRYGLEERIRELAVVNRHLLAVPRDLVRAVCGDSVVAGAAHDQVHARRTVPGEDHVGAVSGVDGVFLGVGLVAVDQEVVTFLAHYIVGALGAENRIVAGAPHQDIVASAGGIFVSVVHYNVTPPTE